MSKGFRMKQSMVLLCVLFFFTALFAQQSEVTLPPTQDNTIYSENDSTSNGSGIYFFAGKTSGGATRRALVRFDLSGKIPANAIVTNAVVKLRMSRTSSESQSISLHKVLIDWGEGISDAGNQEGKGALAQTNDATWKYSKFASTQWTSKGGDFAATSSASLSVNAVGPYQFGSTAGLVADVQGWLQSPATNFGWLIKGNETVNGSAKRFDSRENTVEANRPALVVTYTIPTAAAKNEMYLAEFALHQNYPNPFNPSTTIPFTLSRSSYVTLTVHDFLGRTVAQLLNGVVSAGEHSVDFNGSTFSSGIYFYRLRSGDRTAVKKFILAK